MLDLTPERPVPSPWGLLKPARFAFLSALIDKALARGYALTGKDRYDDFRLERVEGMPIVVTPSVFNPKSLRTGAFFAAHIDSRVVPGGADVLDMGTGSGVCAVAAARFARRVVAVDINSAAVRCAAMNALLNHREHRIEVRHGDLFAPVAGERFDLILFNPPFLRGIPRDDRDRAWRSNDVAERFAAGLGAHLNPGSSALVLLSSFGAAQIFLDEFRRHGFALSVLAERRFINERLAIFRLQPPELEGAA
jgi:release factor glutamine methyltransferase